MPLKPTVRPPLFMLTILIAILIPSLSQAPLGAQAPLQVIASGLDNPRGLAFGPDGALYVVEAGRGGSSPLCLPENSAPPGRFRCYGPTGAVTRITGIGVQERVVTGLPSLAVPGGDAATGPHDIDFGFGNAFITIGFGGDPAVRAPFIAAGIGLGNLVRVLPNGTWSYVVDLSAYETAANPDGGAIDTNPYGLRVLADQAIFTDAGANALLRIGLDGRVSTLAAFPNRLVPSPLGGIVPMQSVPTSVSLAPDGNYYVGELTGFPFPVGAAQVYRVPPQGGTPVVVATGFTNIIDVVIDRNGVGYVLEHDADGLFAPLGPSEGGRLTRVTRDGTRTVIASTGLVRPGALAIGTDGAIYVTNRSVSAGGGEVVRIVVP
jgi:hypothetical protein